MRKIATPAETSFQCKEYDPVLLTAEAAKYLGLSTEGLLRLARRREIGVIPGKPGRSARFRLSALNTWARSNEQRPIRAAQ